MTQCERWGGGGGPHCDVTLSYTYYQLKKYDMIVPANSISLIFEHYPPAREASKHIFASKTANLEPLNNL